MSASTTGYPSSLTVLTPRGPCSLIMRWSYAQLPLTDESTGPRWRAAQASAQVACYRWKASDDTTYSTHAAVDVNEADLTWGDMTIDIRRPVGTPGPTRIPKEHRELWRQDAAAVLKNMLTAEHILMLRRTDSLGALRAARRVV